MQEFNRSIIFLSTKSCHVNISRFYCKKLLTQQLCDDFTQKFLVKENFCYLQKHSTLATVFSRRLFQGPVTKSCWIVS